MQLRAKVFSILAGMTILSSCIIYYYSRIELLNEYSKLEINSVQQDLRRTNKTLDNMFSSLKTLSFDWSQWDDAYKFMHDKNSAFIKSNMAFTTFENAKLNLILFFDTKNNLFYGIHYDLAQKKFVPLAPDLIATIQAEKIFPHSTLSPEYKTGILKTNSGYLALSAATIMTSQGKGPVAGILMMGYFFSGEHLAKLSDIIEMKVDLHPLPLPANAIYLNKIYKNLINNQPTYIEATDNNYINGYTLIRDMDKDPIGILSIQIPRTLYYEGVKTINRYLIIIIGMGALLLLSMVYLLKRYVLDRIIDVSHQVIQIKSNSNFKRRIFASGSDEITNMVTALNSLLELIELSQDQLKYRIFQRTEELGQIANLNKNLHHEISKQKAVEHIMREDEKILRHLAYYDVLTELPNRYFFHEILQKTLAKAEREGSGIAILFVDADKFKQINDTYGHDVGDKYLIHTANQIKQSIKGTDIAARLAGDEFIICLNQIHHKAILEAIVQKILKQLSTPLKIDEIEISSSFSMGIAIYPEDGSTVEELERNADLAMYYAKKQHASSYCFFDMIKSTEETIY